MEQARPTSARNSTTRALGSANQHPFARDAQFALIQTEGSIATGLATDQGGARANHDRPLRQACRGHRRERSSGGRDEGSAIGLGVAHPVRAEHIAICVNAHAALVSACHTALGRLEAEAETADDNGRLLLADIYKREARQVRNALIQAGALIK